MEGHFISGSEGTLSGGMRGAYQGGLEDLIMGGDRGIYQVEADEVNTSSLLAPSCKDGVSRRIFPLLPPFVRGELTKSAGGLIASV